MTIKDSKALSLEMAAMGMDDLWLVMQDIHRIFGTPAPESPEAQSDFLRDRRAVWVESEVDELREATSVVDQADAYLDIIVFGLGGLVELGVQPGELIRLVLESQYAKIWSDGKPRVDANGKWIKPDGWVAPEALMGEEIERQMKEYG